MPTSVKIKSLTRLSERLSMSAKNQFGAI